MNFTKLKITSFLLFMVFALFMFLVFRSYIIEKQNNGVKADIVNTKKFIKKSIEFLIDEKKQFYLNTSKIIFSDDRVLNALINKDRDEFYEHVKNYYNRAKIRDKGFWGLHLILPDNMSFIRVHRPDVVDKIIPKGDKPLIDEVNKTHQQVTSFDSGKFGYFLRVVTPIFTKQDKYLGAAEFSINVDSLTQYIKDKLGFEALFLVKNINNKAFLNGHPKTQDGLTIFKATNKSFYEIYSVASSASNNPSSLYNIFLDEKNKSLSSVLIKLSESATLAVAFDVTNIINEQRIFKENVTSLVLFVIFVFSIIWFFATAFYIRNKKHVASQLQKFHDIISKNIIFSNIDLDGVITDVSDAFCHVTGYTREQLIGSSHSKLRHPDTKNLTYDELWITIKTNQVWRGELKHLKQNGELFWAETTISPKFDKNHKKIGYMSIKQDITDRKKIETISITDGLCGIYNRRHFDNVFQKYINAAKRKNEQVCLVILDIDYFKQYNDTYGHQMGDDVLINIAQSLQNSLHRADDCCFRLGGEEFSIIFKAEDKATALSFADNIRLNIENLKIPHNGSAVNNYVTASFGLACKNSNDIKNADEIFKDADDLLYKAKNSGRNKVEINM